MAKRRPKSPDAAQRFTEKVFAPYTTGIGQVALAWNDLMDELGGLFTTLIPTGGDDFLILEKIWNVPKADRQKRDLLDAVVNYAVAYDFNLPRASKLARISKSILSPQHWR
jgi:hypothetical protein